MALSAGSAVVDITPRTPCNLAGFASRDHAHEGVHDPIALRALYVRGEGGDGLLVSADVISYTAGGDGGYVPVAEAYDTGGYEVRVAPYAETAEAVLRQGFLDLTDALD